MRPPSDDARARCAAAAVQTSAAVSTAWRAAARSGVPMRQAYDRRGSAPETGPAYAPDMTADCVFCSIVAGAVPAHRVWEDDHTVAFLDARPVFPGHTLVVPRPHVVTLPELPDDLLGPLFSRARSVAA